MILILILTIDSIINLCRLADVNHRLHRATHHDNNLLSNEIITENEKLQKINESLIQRRESLEHLTSTDNDSIVTVVITKLQQELEIREEILKFAEIEEEKAKQIYLKAVSVRKQANEKVTIIEKITTTATKQRESLIKIHNIRIETDEYQSVVLSSRLNIYQNILKYLNIAKKQLNDEYFGNEISELFHNLINSFQYNLNQSNSNQNSTQTLHGIRIGFEIIRLWKQLNIKDVNNMNNNDSDITMINTISLLETEFHSLETKLSEISSSAILTSNVSLNRNDNTTVVLYYDHLVHNTPPNHIESQARIITSLNILRNQSTNYDNSQYDRSIQIVSCNDVISPPLWLLPLVHSSNYLHNLWLLAIEAKEYDLLVPLEFDTEWESEIEVDNENEIATTLTGRSKQEQLITIKLPEDISFNLNINNNCSNSNISQQFINIFKPFEGDNQFNNLIINNIKLNNAMLLNNNLKGRGRPKRSSQTDMEDSINKENDRRRRPKRVTIPEKVIEVTVLTPYGKGIVPINQTKRSDNIIQVYLLNWKATGYFSINSIQLFKEKLFGGLTLTQIRQAINEDYSSVKPMVVTSDGRFQFNNAVIHKLFHNLINFTGKQSLLTDKIGLDRAKSSLWLHGRTSMNLTKNIENMIILWLYKLDHLEINRKLSLEEDNIILNMFKFCKTKVNENFPPILCDDETINENQNENERDNENGKEKNHLSINEFFNYYYSSIQIKLNRKKRIYYFNGKIKKKIE